MTAAEPLAPDLPDPPELPEDLPETVPRTVPELLTRAAIGVLLGLAVSGVARWTLEPNARSITRTLTGR